MVCRRGRAAALSRLRLLVIVHAVREEAERRAYRRVLGWYLSRGAELHFVAWDRGKSVLEIDELGTVREIEAINRWRLPIWLGKAGLRPLARLLRHARIRWWWGRARPTAVVCLGLVRPEMVHYAPPGVRVGALLGYRDPEEPESVEATVGLADAVLTVDEATAERCRAVDPGADVRVVPDLIPRLAFLRAMDDRPRLSEAVGVGPEELLVAGLGPVDWRGGPDLFLRIAALVRRSASDLSIRFAWLGGELGDRGDPNSFPYRFDAERLGLADRLRWLGHRDDDRSDVLRRCDVLVLTFREPFAVPYEPVLPRFENLMSILGVAFEPPGPPFPALLSMLELPVVALALPAVDEVTGRVGTRVPYPDVGAAADNVVGILQGSRPLMVDHLTGVSSR